MRGSLAACLRQIVKEDKLSLPTNDGSVVLREKDVMKVDLSDLTSDAVAVRLDRMGKLSGLRDDRWQQSLCDYLIVNRVGDQVCVLFVELKRALHQDDRVRAFEQLRRSLPLLKYLCTACAIQFGSDDNRLCVRYVLVAEKGNTSFDKQGVRPRRSLQPVQHEDITIARRIVSKKVRFKQLWGD